MWGALLLGAIALGMPPDPIVPVAAATAADAVTLRDGQVALGQVVEPAPRGKVVLLARRDWLEQHLPDWAKRWEATERTWAPRARRDRIDRLNLWRRDVGANQAGNDRLASDLDQEIQRLGEVAENPKTVLMAVQISRADVRKVARQPSETGRLLRQGWRGGFADVETMPLDDLKNALEGRGFARNGLDPAPVDDLLPIMPEPEATWQLRRAATEVALEPGLRFIRYQGLVLPEQSGAAPGAAAGMAPALISSLLKNLLGDQPAPDPLAAQLRTLAARGQTGAVVTRLDLTPDLAGGSVETTLWVRRAADRWEPVITRATKIRPETNGPNGGNQLAEDPQVKAALGIVEALGLGQVDPNLRKRSLNMGAATQQALALARETLDHDLRLLELRFEHAPGPETKPSKEPAPKP
jgi:hypothetical protein